MTIVASGTSWSGVNDIYGFNFFHGGHGYASFPSGHTAVTCAVVTVLWDLLSDMARTLRARVVCRCHRPRGCQLPFLERRDCQQLRRHLKRLDAHLALEAG
jgi:hypothetical protein